MCFGYIKSFCRSESVCMSNELMDRQVPLEVRTSLMATGSLSADSVKWGNKMLHVGFYCNLVTLNLGVRQGGVLQFSLLFMSTAYSRSQVEASTGAE